MFKRTINMIEKPVVRLRVLDKITAITTTMNVNIGDTAESGDLRIRPRSCQKNPPIEKPESAGFLEIWETKARKDPKAKPKWIFSGWMFASSPGLSAMDHPLYDVWVIDCLNKPAAVKKETTKKETEDADNKDENKDHESGIVQ